MEAAVATTQGQTADYQFLLSQHEAMLKDKENEVAMLKKRLTSLLGYGPEDNVTLSPPGGSKTEDTSSYAKDLGMNSELLSVIKNLQEELRIAKESDNQLRVEVKALREGVENRESEIHRLRNFVEDPNIRGAGLRASHTGVSSTTGSLNVEEMAVARENARLIEQLNDQIDFLSAELAAREVGVSPDSSSKIVADSQTKLSALQLEVTRLTTRLEAMQLGRERAEKENTALREEVASLLALVAEAQTAAQEAVREAQIMSHHYGYFEEDDNREHAVTAVPQQPEWMTTVVRGSAEHEGHRDVLATPVSAFSPGPHTGTVHSVGMSTIPSAQVVSLAASQRSQSEGDYIASEAQGAHGDDYAPEEGDHEYAEGEDAIPSVSSPGARPGVNTPSPSRIPSSRHAKPKKHTPLSRPLDAPSPLALQAHGSKARSPTLGTARSRQASPAPGTAATAWTGPRSPASPQSPLSPLAPLSPNTARTHGRSPLKSPLPPGLVPRSALQNTLQELARLQAEHARIAAAAESVSRDRQGYITEIQLLEHTVSDLQSKLDSMNALYETSQEKIVQTEIVEIKLKSELSATRENVERLQAELESVNEKLRVCQFAKDSLEMEASSLRPSLDRSNKDVQSLRDELLTVRTELAALQGKYAILKSEKDTADEQITLYQLGEDRGKSQLHHANNEITHLREEFENTLRILKGKDQELQNYHAKETNWAHERNALTTLHSQFEIEREDLQQQLAIQSRNLTEANTVIARLQELADTPKEIQALREEIAQFHARVMAAEAANERVLREKQRLEQQISDHVGEIESLRSYREQQIEALRASERKVADLQRDLQESSFQRMSLQQEFDRITLELCSIGSELKLAKQSEDRWVSEVQTLQNERNKTLEELDSMRHMQQDLREKAAKAEAEAHDRQVSLTSTQRLLNEAQTQVGKLSRELASTAQALERSQQACNDSLLRLEKEAKAAATANSMHHAVSVRCAELTTQLEQFKSLFVQLESTRQTTGKQLEKALLQVEELEKESAAHQETVVELRKKNTELETEIGKLQAGMSLLEAEERSLTQQLDSAQELLKTRAGQIATLQKQLRNQKQEEENVNAQCLRLNSTLANKEKEIAALRTRCEQIEEEKRQALLSQELTQQEALVAAEDIAALVRESQTLTATITENNSTMNDLRMSLESVRVSLVHAETAVGTLQGERAELLQLYTHVCEERSALLSEVEALGVAKRRLEERIEVLSQESNAIRSAWHAEQNTREEMETLVSNLQLQLESIALELQEARMTNEATVHSAEEAQLEATGARVTVQSFSNALTSLRENLARTQVEAESALQQATIAIEEKREASALVDSYRKKCESLETMLTNARLEIAKAALSEAKAKEAAENMHRKVVELEDLLSKERNKPGSTQFTIAQTSTSSTADQKETTVTEKIDRELTAKAFEKTQADMLFWQRECQKAQEEVADKNREITKLHVRIETLTNELKEKEVLYLSSAPGAATEEIRLLVSRFRGLQAKEAEYEKVIKTQATRILELEKQINRYQSHAKRIGQTYFQEKQQ